MTDVSKIHGPSGPAGDSGKKEKSSADSDRFKDEMRKRVTEVSKIDPDEKKKRKQGEEGEDEDLNAPQAGPTTPAEQVTPFSLEQGTKKVSPLDMQKEGPGISPMQSAQPTPTPPNTKSSFYQAPAADELSDDSGVLEEESFGTPPSLKGPLEQPQYGSTPPPPQQPSGWKPEGQRPVAAGPPQSQQQQPQQRMPQQTPVGPPEGKKDGVSGVPQKITPPSKTRESQGTTSDELRDTQASKQQDSVFFEQMGKDKEGSGEKKSEEVEEDNAISGAAPQNTPFSQTQEDKTEEKEKVASPESLMLASGATEAQMVPTAAPGPETLPPYAHLSPQIQEMFDRMVGVMTVMSQSGMTETTITLNSPQFASSIFFGTQIIIQEFSTAPQAFNIQLNGTPEAVALIQNNADDLMAAFQAGNYGFRVNRFETGYLGARPLIKRKEKAEGDKQDQPGDHP